MSCNKKSYNKPRDLGGSGGESRIENFEVWTKEKFAMKKIAIVAVNGKAGKKIAEEASKRGWEVLGIGRADSAAVATTRYLKKDLFDLTAEDLKGFDAVVDAFGAWTPETLPLHSSSLKKLCDLLSGSEERLIVVGGAGSLYANKEHTEQVKDGANFPDAFKPLASAMGKALDELRARDDVRWTYISPAIDFQPDGERTGRYLVAGEELAFNERGESEISYADYAIAVVDEIEKGDAIRRRISVLKR